MWGWMDVDVNCNLTGVEVPEHKAAFPVKSSVMTAHPHPDMYIFWNSLILIIVIKIVVGND